VPGARRGGEDPPAPTGLISGNGFALEGEQVQHLRDPAAADVAGCRHRYAVAVTNLELARIARADAEDDRTVGVVDGALVHVAREQARRRDAVEERSPD